MVFLNVCETGQPNWDAADLRGGWPDRFIGAGCAGIVAPSWRVVGQVARAAATHYYQELAAGRTMAEAVRDVRRQAFAASTEARLRGHPSWLAYRAFGSPRATVAGMVAHSASGMSRLR